MPVHKVRFDNDTEDALEEVCRAKNLPVAEVLRRGILLLREGLFAEPSPGPFEIYKTIDLGPGGDAKAPARFAKRGVAQILRRAHRS
jgi:hypothetical protein